MKSGKKPSPKKTALLDVGKELFLTQGYHATSVDAICEAASVTKGSFFYYFNSKQHFAESILEHIWQPIIDMREAALREKSEPLEYIRQHVRFMAVFLREDGRLMGVLNQDLGQTQPDVGEKLRNYFLIWVDYLTELVTAAINHYPDKVSFEATTLVDMMIATIEGTPFIARMRGEKNVDDVIVHIEKYLSLLFDQS